LLSGNPPFGGCGGSESLAMVRDSILLGEVRFEPKEIWEGVSDSAKDFILSLLVSDPRNRPSATECQQHPWLHKWDSSTPSTLSPSVVESMLKFREIDNMTKLISEVLSFTLLPDQIGGLREEFEQADLDGCGEINLEQLQQVLANSATLNNSKYLSSDEVQTIFNAIRVSSTATTIHYHEFLAACLSQCHVDERNLHLAFSKLDCERKGYISIDNIIDMIGSDMSEESVRTMFADAMTKLLSSGDTIDFEQFKELMAGFIIDPAIEGGEVAIVKVSARAKRGEP